MQLKNLNTNFLGRNIYYYKSIDSTQSEVWRKIKEGNIKDGDLIFADIQTSGMGTHSKKWITDEKNNIAFSIYCEMSCNIEKLEGLTTKIAEIIIQIFKTKYAVELDVKKPNDIFYNGKKLGGILTESKTLSNKVKYLVIGIGINTNKQQFTDEIKGIATSIRKEFGIIVDTQEFIAEFCNRFENEIIQRREKQ